MFKQSTPTRTVVVRMMIVGFFASVILAAQPPREFIKPSARYSYDVIEGISVLVLIGCLVVILFFGIWYRKASYCEYGKTLYQGQYCLGMRNGGCVHTPSVK